MAAAALLTVAGGGAAEPLTLFQAVEEALAKSPALAKARLDVSDAELDEPLLLAETDPRFVTGYRWSDDQAPRTQPAFQGTRSRTEAFDVGILQRTLIGTEARLGWTNLKTSNPATFRPLDPTVDSRLVLDVRQPLLRYLWGRPDRARRGALRSGVQSARGRLRAGENDAAAAAARAYLRLHVAERALGIAEGALATARDLRSSYAEKRRYGLVEESDLFQAEVSVQVQELELTLARSELENARTALLAELQRHTADRPADVTPAGLPALPPAPADEDAVVRAALARRPDLAAAREVLAAAEWAARTARLETLPELDFTGSYGVAGLDADHPGAWKDLRSRDHPIKSAGLNLTVPFGGRKERLSRRAARFRVESARQDVELAVQRVISEARQAWVALRAARDRAAAARRLLELEGKKREAAEADFRRGRATTDLLVRFRQDLHLAERRLLQAESDEVQARLELGRVTGTLLDLLAEARS
jgi:outer membrane protein TolC